MSQIKKRHNEMMENFENLPALEKLYFDIGADLGLFNDQLAQYYGICRNVRKNLKEEETFKSVAAFNSKYKDTDEYIVLKQCEKYIDGLAKMMAGVRVRIESLKAESKGIN